MADIPSVTPAATPSTPPAPILPVSPHSHKTLFIIGGIFILVVVSLLAGGLLFENFSAPAAQQSNEKTATTQTVSYEPTIITLGGRLIMESHFGPPGFGETPDTDQKENVPMLILSFPVNVQGDNSNQINQDSFSNVSKVQLILASSTNASSLVGQTISVTGSLSEAISGEQYTPVVLTVKDIK